LRFLNSVNVNRGGLVPDGKRDGTLLHVAGLAEAVIRLNHQLVEQKNRIDGRTVHLQQL
jgi:hypothetical protein